MAAISRLIVTFHRTGRKDETRYAASGERAVKIALLMIARYDALRHGDQLTVSKPDDGALDHTPLPPPRGGPKQ
jgi:hypothetical protein